MKKILLSVYLGNTLETYDFILCGLLVKQISPFFFPTANSFLSIMLGLLIFGIGFLARPLGALYFGHKGDTEGRKTALLQSLFGMSFSTCCLALILV